MPPTMVAFRVGAKLSRAAAVRIDADVPIAALHAKGEVVALSAHQSTFENGAAWLEADADR